LYGYEEARSGRLEPLAWAAEGHHDAVVELLINSMRQLPKDMLSQAVRRGHEVVVRLMLQHGRTNFKLVPMESLLALRFAANAGRAAMVRVLLENGKIDAHSNARNEPLLMAASSGHGAVVELLLDTGIFEVEARDKHRNTPLSLAASRGHEAVVRLLLATSDVDVLNRNIHEDTPLMQAIDGGHDGVVRLLLDTGKCDLDTRNKRGETPLSRAITKAQQAETLSPSLQGSLENEWGALNWPSEREREGLQAIITMLREASEKGPSPDKVLLEPGNVDSYSQEPLPHKPTLLRKIARGRKHMVKLRQLGDM
jgi:ankyrin repeat protein